MDFLLAVVLKMGVMGLAVATSLGNWAYMIIAGSFFLTKKASLKYSFGSINWKEIGTMLSIGFPNALLSLLSAFRSCIFNKTLAAYDGLVSFNPNNIPELGKVQAAIDNADLPEQAYSIFASYFRRRTLKVGYSKNRKTGNILTIIFCSS